VGEWEEAVTLRRLDPPRVLVLSFAVLIACGTVLLRQPWAAREGRQLTWAEALFTATSATCVTGLSVRPPGDHSTAGQVVILALIQIGGLGIMTFGLFVSLLLGRRLSLFGRNLLLSSLAHTPWEDFWPLLRMVVAATAVVEALGAALLAAGWWSEKGVAAIPWGVFHAVSAFCNAGFGLHPASLAPWRAHPVIPVVIGLLVLVGGVGFVPITELVERGRGRERHPLSLHTRTALAMSAALLVIGWAGFAILERSSTLAGMPLGERVLAVWLQGIVPRTAGFSSVDIGAVRPATLLLLIVLMFIGASPGSTGGGVKTTTVGVMLALVIARIRSRRQVSLFGRGIGQSSAASAVTVVVVALSLVAGGAFLLVAAEHGGPGGPESRVRFLAELFEVVSAFGTVGLSTGVTPELSSTSWMVLVVLMFAGRVGPLTLGLALAGRQPRVEPRFVEEEMMIG